MSEERGEKEGINKAVVKREIRGKKWEWKMFEEIAGDNDGTGWKQLKKSEEIREENNQNITLFLVTILKLGTWNLEPEFEHIR